MQSHPHLTPTFTQPLTATKGAQNRNIQRRWPTRRTHITKQLIRPPLLRTATFVTIVEQHRYRITMIGIAFKNEESAQPALLQCQTTGMVTKCSVPTKTNLVFMFPLPPLRCHGMTSFPGPTLHARNEYKCKGTTSGAHSRADSYLSSRKTLSLS